MGDSSFARFSVLSFTTTLVVHETHSWKRCGVWARTGSDSRVLAFSPDVSFAAIGGETCEVKGRIICHPQIVIVDMEKHQIARTIEGAFSDNTRYMRLPGARTAHQWLPERFGWSRFRGRTQSGFRSEDGRDDCKRTRKDRQCELDPLQPNRHYLSKHISTARCGSGTGNTRRSCKKFPPT